MIQSIHAPPDTLPDLDQEVRPRMAPEPRPLNDLFRELRDETSSLLREEVELAQTITTEAAARANRNMSLMVAGALVAHAGLIFLLWASMHGLTLAMAAAGVSNDVSAWLAPLVTGLVVAAIGAAVMFKAAAGLRNAPRDSRWTVPSIEQNRLRLNHQ